MNDVTEANVPEWNITAMRAQTNQKFTTITADLLERITAEPEIRQLEERRAETMNGQLTVDSTPKGTTVKLLVTVSPASSLKKT